MNKAIPQTMNSHPSLNGTLETHHRDQCSSIPAVTSVSTHCSKLTSSISSVSYRATAGGVDCTHRIFPRTWWWGH